MWPFSWSDQCMYCKQWNCKWWSAQCGGILQVSDGRGSLAEPSMFADILTHPLWCRGISVCILTNSRHQSCMCCRCYVWAFSRKDYPSLEECVIFSVSHSLPVCIKENCRTYSYKSLI